MTGNFSKDQILIRRLTDIILANLANENFGVKELAGESGMSRYSLNRRLRAISNKTTNQFINEIRLQKALEMLRSEELTAAEVSYRTGFSSPAYFTKCFHDFFGYSPGTVRKGDIYKSVDKNIENIHSRHEIKRTYKRVLLFISSGILIIAISGLCAYYISQRRLSNKKESHLSIPEKAIAILPFKNLSNNPDDRYLYDGVMDEILTNLSRIHDLRVVSRTSVEQFRESTITTSAIAKKLKIDYLVETSGQKYGNTFRLRVQLIEAATDKHIWAKSYEKEIKETKDIFNIQSEVAQKIAAEVNASITPEEKLLIDKIPTRNLTAYDFYLRAQDELKTYKSILIYRSDDTNKMALKQAEFMFKKALAYDSTFGRAYIGLADIYWAKHWSGTYFTQNFLDSVLVLANRALSYDNQLDAGYYYRGEYFNQKGETRKALNEYNMALKYNPNYWEVYFAIGQNVYLYSYDQMDFVKGLEYLHKAVSINHGKELPFLLRELGDAYGGWAGFPEKKEYYFLEAFRLDKDSLSLRIFSSEKEKLKTLTKSFSEDSTNLWTILNLARTYLNLGEYGEALKYTRKYENRVNERSYLFYSGRTGIGYVYWQNGNKKEAEKWFNQQKRISEESLKLGRYYSMDAYCDLANIYAITGDKEKAYENLRRFAKNHLFPYYRITWIKEDPMLNSLRNDPEFQTIIKDMESKYKSGHERVANWLQKMGKKNDSL